MNIKRTRPEIKKSRLENEVILAVVILYVLLSAALLAIHHIQPEDVETMTSSSSPSHSGFSASSTATAAAPASEALSLDDAHQILIRDGFHEIRDIRAGGKGVQATGIKEGKTWEVEVDAATRQITRSPQPAH